MISQEVLDAHYQTLKALHAKWKPHSGQIEVGRALLNDYKSTVFLQCARKWGKTELAIYLLYRHCLETENAAAYYYSPFQKQSKEILWANKRLQNFFPEVIEGEPNNTEMRIRLKNGSFIKVDGSDNLESSRGITPTFVVYDEFKDFKRDFHRAMSPNFAARKAQNLIMGSPPKIKGEFLEIAEECKTEKSSAFFKQDIYKNPHIDRDWIESERLKLLARGEVDVWEREYLANFVLGGSQSIFPMFQREKFVKTHDELLKEIQRDRHKFQWFIVNDPGTVSVFGVLILALNPYTKHWYVLDEVYEKQTAKTSVDQIWPTVERKRKEFYPDDLSFGERSMVVYDEAAAWFANEIIQRFDVNPFPTTKAYHKKEMGLSLLKDILLQKVITISDRCQNFMTELENYVMDDYGRIPKENDHLIDCFRYALGASHYSLNEDKEPNIDFYKEPKKFYTIEDDFPKLFGDNDYAIDQELLKFND